MHVLLFFSGLVFFAASTLFAIACADLNAREYLRASARSLARNTRYQNARLVHRASFYVATVSGAVLFYCVVRSLV